jgi:hypothetical protein
MQYLLDWADTGAATAATTTVEDVTGTAATPFGVFVRGPHRRVVCGHTGRVRRPGSHVARLHLT